MQKIEDAIEMIRAKAKKLEKRSINEAQTRDYLINPMLKALGWDTENPDDVRSEDSTFDGKAVDYVLFARDKDEPVLVVEAKPLGNRLEDPKGIGQVISYANNAGIAFCVLTNGVTWKVYSTFEDCPAPEKLMFRFSLDPQHSAGMATRELAETMERFSRDKLDTLGDWWKETRCIKKVYEVLDRMLREPDGQFCNVVRNCIAKKDRPSKQYVKNAIMEWAKMHFSERSSVSVCGAKAEKEVHPEDAVNVNRKSKIPRGGTEYDESHHVNGKPAHIVELYREVDRYCLLLGPAAVERRPLKVYIGYFVAGHSFCTLYLQRKQITIHVNLDYSSLQTPPDFVRDVTNIGHLGNGDLEIKLRDMSQLEEVKDLIKQSYNAKP